MHITRHGAERVRERLGVPKRAVARRAALALERGRPREDFSGSFRKYLDAKFRLHHVADNMRVFGNHLFLFQGDILITAWTIPLCFRKAAHHE